MPRPRTLLLTAAGWLALHAVVWALVVKFVPTQYPWWRDVRSIFEHWDAWHYSVIANFGYAGPVRWAFYPLYPLTVRALGRLTGLQTRPDLVGVIFSTFVFALFCLLQARLSNSADERLHALKPETLWGWLCFLSWPASWVFHSHHTEALFLLLSFGAFVAARKGRWLAAALLAGLCALTRNQGVFVAVAVACTSAWPQREWRRRCLIFTGSGLISFLLFALWPAYQYWATGNPFMSLVAQGQFAPQATTLYQFAGTIWFANFWQHPTWNFYLHHVLFLVLNLALVALLRRREYALSLYVGLSLWLPLYLGQLENTYRYGAILFPALFTLGELARRLPWSMRWTLLGALVWLNLVCTWDYAVGLWAY